MSLILVDPTLRDARTEVDQQTDRGAAIIACAIVDELLTRALKRRLILTTKIEDYLFNHEKNGPLATFNNKINLAYAVGILNGDVRSDLHNIRRIRNRFAHKLEPRTFDDKKIAGWCASLNAPPKIQEPRKRYLYVAFGASAALLIVSRVNIRLTELQKEPGLGATIVAEMDVVKEELARYAERASSPGKSEP